jgi:hypothetical protein
MDDRAFLTVEAPEWGKRGLLGEKECILNTQARASYCERSKDARHVTKFAQRPIDSAIKLDGSRAREWAWPLTKRL